MEILYFITFVIIAAILLQGFSPTNVKTSNRQFFNYRKNTCLFTKAERSFLGVLEQAVGDEYIVYGKVRIGDILKPERGLSQSERQTARNKIDRKHFDFILCREDDRSIVCAIELNDISHQGLMQQKRDIFVRKACESAGLPLIEAPAQKTYSLQRVREHVTNAINAQNISYEGVGNTQRKHLEV